MRRRRRDSRPADPRSGSPRGRAELQKDQRFVELLRRFQLAGAAVMLMGLTTATLVCAGEFKHPWVVGAGGGVFGLGLLIYAVARPLTRWWTGLD